MITMTQSPRSRSTHFLLNPVAIDNESDSRLFRSDVIVPDEPSNKQHALLEL